MSHDGEDGALKDEAADGLLGGELNGGPAAEAAAVEDDVLGQDANDVDEKVVGGEDVRVAHLLRGRERGLAGRDGVGLERPAVAHVLVGEHVDAQVVGNVVDEGVDTGEILAVAVRKDYGFLAPAGADGGRARGSDGLEEDRGAERRREGRREGGGGRGDARRASRGRRADSFELLDDL